MKNKKNWMDSVWNPILTEPKFNDIGHDSISDLSVKSGTVVRVSENLDMFGDKIPDSTIIDIFNVFKANKNKLFVILTSNINRVAKLFTGFSPNDFKNVMITAICSSQEDVNKVVPELFKLPLERIALSINPMVGNVSLSLVEVGKDCFLNALSGEVFFEGAETHKDKKISWVYVTGECSDDVSKQISIDSLNSLFKECWGHFTPIFIDIPEKFNYGYATCVDLIRLSSVKYSPIF